MFNININKDWIPFIAIAILVMVLLGQCSRVSSLKENVKTLSVDVENAKSNYAASKDTVEMYVNQNGYLEAEIKTYAISSTDAISDYSELLKKYRTSLNLNKKLDGVNSLLTTQLTRKDSVIVYTELKADSTFTFIDSVDYGDNNTRFLQLDGKLNGPNVSGNIILKQSITLNAVIENIDGVNSMRLSTKYPFDDIKIEGINIINNELNIYKKKSRWNVNFGLGYGTYPINGSVKITPFVGVMLGYSPKWLQF